VPQVEPYPAPLEPGVCHLVMAVETFCVDLDQHLNGVTRPLGNLRRQYSPRLAR